MNVEQELGYQNPIGWKGKLQAVFLGKGFDSCAGVLPSQRSVKVLAEGVLGRYSTSACQREAAGNLGPARAMGEGVQMFFQECCRCLHWKKCQGCPSPWCGDLLWLSTLGHTLHPGVSGPSPLSGEKAWACNPTGGNTKVI